MIRIVKGILQSNELNHLRNLFKSFQFFSLFSDEKKTSKQYPKPYSYEPFFKKQQPSDNLNSSTQSKSSSQKCSSLWSKKGQNSENNQSSRNLINFKKSLDDFIQQSKLNQKTKVQMNQKNQNTQIIKSSFHKQGIIDQKMKQIKSKLLDCEKIDFKFRNQLIEVLKKLISERQQLISHQFDENWYNLQTQKIINQQHSFILNYIDLYKRLKDIVGKIVDVLRCEESLKIQIDVHEELLEIIKCFRMNKYIFTYSLFILQVLQMNVNISKEQQCTKINSQALLMIVQKKKAFEIFVRMVDKVHQCIKLGIRSDNFLEISQRLNRCYRNHLLVVMENYQLNSLKQKVKLLTKLQQIFQQCPLSPSRQLFYLEFFKSICQNQLTKQINEKMNNIESFLDLTLLVSKNFVFEEEIVEKVNQIMIIYVKDESFSLSEGLINKIMAYYAYGGRIPDEVYQKSLKPYLYTLLESKNPSKVYQASKFFIYSELKDQEFLPKFVEALKNIQNFSNIQKEMKESYVPEYQQNLAKGYHIVFHYLTIKYPSLKQVLSSLKVPQLCSSIQQKDLILTKKILDSLKSQVKPTTENQTFINPCIMTQNIIKPNFQIGGFHKLQENIFSDNIQSILNELNQSSKGNFYQMRKSFSFCIYELDFVVIKWDSEKKEKILRYLSIEAVGSQYCYDRNSVNRLSDKQNSRKLYETSLINYEKELIFERRKQIRKKILQHYGWEILEVSNRYTYTNLIDRRTFKEKLRQAILVKMSKN